MTAHNVVRPNRPFHDCGCAELRTARLHPTLYLGMSEMDQSSLCYPCHSRPPRENSPYRELLDAYRSYLVQARGVSRPEPHIRVAACFFALLQARERRLEEMSAADIQLFIMEQGRYYQRKTVAAIASFLRGFLRYAAFNRLVPQDFSESVRRPYIFHGEREPRYLQDWQVCHVLNAVDQSTYQGKRDYAILLLLAVYGLRGNEVAGLRLEDCHWAVGKLSVCDRKCGDAMDLPLTAEIAEALVAYLRVRPKTEHREIFLGVFRPYPPLRAEGLHAIAAKSIRRCGFPVTRPGSHTFRYSLAQALFAAQRPLSEIAAALGHCDLRTTLGYISFTVHPLRELALGAGEGLA